MNSFFRNKVYPIVETVEDVVNNKEILVFTTSNINDFKWFNKWYPGVGDRLIEELNMDKLYYEKEKLKEQNELRAKGIGEGKYVDIDYEGFTQNTRHRFAGQFPNLYISEHKYYYLPMALLVGRRHRYSREILALYVT